MFQHTLITIQKCSLATTIILIAGNWWKSPLSRWLELVKATIILTAGNCCKQPSSWWLLVFYKLLYQLIDCWMLRHILSRMDDLFQGWTPLTEERRDGICSMLMMNKSFGIIPTCKKEMFILSTSGQNSIIMSHHHHSVCFWNTS